MPITNVHKATKQTAVSGPSSVADESEDDTYGGQRGRTFAKKHRRKLQAATSGTGTPDLSEVRFSTRRAAKVANYNEDDGLNLSEEDTENVTPNYWTYAEEGGWAIDQVLNHRLKDGAGRPKDAVTPKMHKLTMRSDMATADKHDFEFYVSRPSSHEYHNQC